MHRLRLFSKGVNSIELRYAFWIVEAEDEKTTGFKSCGTYGSIFRTASAGFEFQSHFRSGSTVLIVLR